MRIPVIAYAAAAAVDLLAVAAHLPVLEWVAKPLLAPLLAVYLWRATGTRHGVVIAGLGLAAAGDTALMLSGPVAFAAGTACFLGMQLCYLAAFFAGGAVERLRSRPAVSAGFLSVWAVANVALAPALGPLMTPLVAVYSLALVLMAATAGVRGPGAARGGVLFVVSDLMVGLGAAGVGFTGRTVAVMLTYVAAQFLIVDAFARPCRGGYAREAAGPARRGGAAEEGPPVRPAGAAPEPYTGGP
ncbi:lysoplasmalogenase [Streptomyces sp. MS06]|uniref:lysoplasmalogenase n=1 Tax=Streptomyces sp. MS06 TaxID=3385974 RepID=UPI0039A391B9